MQEAHAASALNHPNIVNVDDVTLAEGLDFISGKRVDGHVQESGRAARIDEFEAAAKRIKDRESLPRLRAFRDYRVQRRR